VNLAFGSFGWSTNWLENSDFRDLATHGDLACPLGNSAAFATVYSFAVATFASLAAC
jgi:hypothetical protein